ncbi:MAG: hypothetical protein KJ917_01165 [Proteobacteria bacterium]|uniref:Uncharacterized protein n=2 Tax=Pseudodesulfovibrio aespoeensis TaxID=182210 RepID=E6VUI0_PSEA9|nr:MULTISPECIES: hypothetical protein [Pseudodesulfovibrio]MBU4379190.1 hypothetical protein [Pseudomonadota bacterium]MCG2733357.1 hypothetical protein [Pseudodesulfovibrio aespoeensis]ADU61125.1 hypothetical protein Daes_0097 [Pseudodesulfovibrio aespoeensis Aspo-2]MBU4476740.1 hypothetical protein [Pseudomonadota bacterium]MBU4517062.1 hypothetical protein [Pseudomonadota bacterium]
MQHTTALKRAKRQEGTLYSLERSSLSVPHPLSIHVGFAITQAAFFTPMPDPRKDDDPLFSCPFPQHWKFQALPVVNCGLIGFSKSFYQGYCAFAEKATDPLHPHLTYAIGSLRYDAPTNNTARRLLQPDDFHNTPRGEPWAIPLYESASKAFLSFRRNARGRGEIFLRIQPPPMPGILCLYRASLAAPGACDEFFYNIPAHMDPDCPVGLAPDCDNAYLGAILLQKTCTGAASWVHQVSFECHDISEGCDTKTIFGRVENDSCHGRQAQPPVFVHSGHTPREHSSKELYALLCKQFEKNKNSTQNPPLCDFVREVDSAVFLVEHSPDTVTDTTVEVLQERLELAEERLRPRLMEGQILLREKLVEAVGPRQTPLDSVLATFVNETRQAWNLLQDIRFRRIPAIRTSGRPRLVISRSTVFGFGPLQGTGDIASLQDGGHCISEPETNTLFILKDWLVQRKISSSCQSIGRMRSDDDGIRLLDPAAKSLFRLSTAGDLVEKTDLDLSAIANGDTLEPSDFLLLGDHILLACQTRENDATVVIQIPPEGLPYTLFHLDHGIFPFEGWALWRNQLIFPSSKTAILNKYSLADGSWGQVQLPICNSNIRGFSICGDLLFLNYPPNLFVYDLAADHMGHSLHIPDVVGKLPIHARTFQVLRDGDSYRLFISTDKGRLATHTLTLDTEHDSQILPLSHEAAQPHNIIPGELSC